MAYSVNLVSTKADCDLLIYIATQEKEALEFKQITLDRQAKVSGNASTELAEDLAAAQLRLSTSNTILATLPEGAEKKKEKAKNKRYDLQVYMLEQRMDDYSAIAKLRREYEKATTVKEQEENTAFIAALEARKTEIP